MIEKDASMSAKQRVGRVALVHYRGGATGEEVVDDCGSGAPQRIVLGAGEIPRGLDEAFLHMEIGEERTVVIPCERGFGFHDPAGVNRYPRTFIENGDKIEKGDVFCWTNPVSGSPIPVECIDADSSSVLIDFNHPLAGKELTYWVKLDGIE